MDSKDIKERLEERKAKMDKLSQTIQEQEEQHEESLKRHKQFLMTKKKPKKSKPPIPSIAASSEVTTVPTESTIASTTIPSTTTADVDVTETETDTEADTSKPTKLEKTPKKVILASTVQSQSSTGRSSTLQLTETEPASSSQVSTTETDVRVIRPKGRKRRSRGSKSKANQDVSKKRSDESPSSDEMLYHIMEVLDSLQKLTYIFMQRLYDTEDVEAAGLDFDTEGMDLNFQLFSLDGDLLFLMEQKAVRCTSFIFFSRSSFENTLYDGNGNKVLKVFGPMVFMSRMCSSSTVTDAHGSLLGYVKTFSNKCNYSVYNARGERLFMLLSNTYLPTTSTLFTIVCQGEQIGVLKYAWKHSFRNVPFLDYETAGVTFPLQMDEREKALLMGAMILIEFTWYSPITRLKVSTLLACLILMVTAFVITALPFILDRQKSYDRTKAYYTPNELEKKTSYYNPPVNVSWT